MIKLLIHQKKNLKKFLPKVTEEPKNKTNNGTQTKTNNRTQTEPKNNEPKEFLI